MPWVPLDIEFVGTPFDGTLLCTGLDDVAHEELPEEALVMLADPSVAKVTFTTTDHRWLKLAGYEIGGDIFDVQVMAWLLDEAQALDLESVSLRYCGIVMDKRISKTGDRLVFKCDDGKIVDLIDAPRDQLCAYNVRDLEATSALLLELWQRLDDAGMLDHFLEDQVPFTAVLVDMMCRGLPIDIPATRALRGRLAGEIETYNAELHAEANLPDAFNLNSGTQLASYLYKKRFELKSRISVPEAVREAPKAERLTMMKTRAPRDFEVASVGLKYAQGHYDLPGLGLPIKARTDSKAPSTSAPKLRVHYGDKPWVSKYLDLKQRTTVDTYLKAYERLAVDGRLYGTFKQTGTVTGRLSSSEPNLQNIPTRSDLGKIVRALFYLGDLFGVHADYSQLEPRLMAHWSQDVVLLDIFRGGKDIYRVTAAYIFGIDVEDVTDLQRGICKTLVLAMGYGAGANKLSQILAENGYPTTETTAASYLKELKQLYRIFFGWKEDVIRGAGAVGYVQTLAGRRRRLVSGDRREGGNNHWKDAELSETQAANAVIQGSAGDIVQRVMVRTSRALPDFGLIVQVHDELMWQIDREPAPFELFKIQRIAEKGHGFNLTVPLKFEPKRVQRWSEGK